MTNDVRQTNKQMLLASPAFRTQSKEREMSIAIAWSAHADSQLLHMRAAGLPWHAVASTLRVGRNSVIERARRLGLPAISRLPLAPRPVLERVDRPALPSGHPLSWLAITSNSLLAGEPYPYPVFL